MCPECGHDKVSTVRVVCVGVVVSYHVCAGCQKHWKIMSFKSGGVGEAELEEMLSRLRLKERTSLVRDTIAYLERKKMALNTANLTEVEKRRKKRADLWEQQFMKQAMGGEDEWGR